MMYDRPGLDFPVFQTGRHPRLHFRGLLTLSLALWPAELLNRPRRPLSRGFDAASCPTTPLVSYQIKPTTIWVEPSSTGEPRLRGALNYPGLIHN